MWQIKVKFCVTGFIVLKGELAKNSSLAFAEEFFVGWGKSQCIVCVAD
jgi:hypothetical protein